MSEEEVQKLIHTNQRLNLILGYAMGFIFNATLRFSKDEVRYKWLTEAIENVTYLDKPLPPMP